MFFSRTNNGMLNKWWWSIDKRLLMMVLLLVTVGVLVSFSATPFIAERIGLPRYYFLKRHFLYLWPSFLCFLFIPLLNSEQIRKLVFGVFVLSVVMIVYALLFCEPIKGARRWMRILGISLQPSEFLKPSFLVLNAWLLDLRYRDYTFNPYRASVTLYALSACLLIAQPDIGMFVVLTWSYIAQYFVYGIGFALLISLFLFSILACYAIYHTMPHFAARLDKFLHPEIGDHYQINMAMDAFARGGLFGVGPGEGVIKKFIPDAHADFVFAVIGEEFGLFVCIAIIVLYFVIFFYVMKKMRNEYALFNILSIVGLLSLFMLQTVINISSSIGLIPSKGMALPFLSFGGSSMCATGFIVGLFFFFTKRKLIGIDRPLY